MLHYAYYMMYLVSDYINTSKCRAVADPGPLLLGVLDSWTPTVNVLQTLMSQISFHIELCPIEARDSISL